MNLLNKTVILMMCMLRVQGEPMPWELDENPPEYPAAATATPLPQPRSTPVRQAQDDKEAAYLSALRKAEGGDAAAALEVARMYRDGTGVEANAGEALVWFRASAMGGNAVAMNLYGVQLWKGEGIKADKAQAVNWFRKASDQGSRHGSFNMGRALAAGQGIEKDIDAALKYFRLAEQRGHSEARKEIEKLTPKVVRSAAASTPTPLPADADNFDKSIDKINRKLDSINGWLDVLNEALE